MKDSDGLYYAGWKCEGISITFVGYPNVHARCAQDEGIEGIEIRDLRILGLEVDADTLPPKLKQRLLDQADNISW